MAAQQAPRVVLEPAERRAGLFLAALAAIAFVAIGVIDERAWAFLGVLLAAAFAAVVVRGNRPATALTSFIMAFGPWGAFFVFGAFYLGFGLWLLMRARRGPD